MEVKDVPSRARALGALALVSVLVVPAALTYAWARPRAVPPDDGLTLVLHPADVRRVRAAHRALRTSASDSELARARRAVYEEANVAEHEGAEPPGFARARVIRLRAAALALREAEGPEALAAARAVDVARFEQALEGELDDEARVQAMGGFGRAATRWALFVDGRRRAPAFVIRTLFAARWNAMHDRPLTEGFEPVELRAYHGWLALRAPEVPLERRLAALDAYEEAGGVSVLEARALILCEAGDPRAVEAFDAWLGHTSSARARNHAIYCSTDGGG